MKSISKNRTGRWASASRSLLVAAPGHPCSAGRIPIVGTARATIDASKSDATCSKGRRLVAASALPPAAKNCLSINSTIIGIPAKRNFMAGFDGFLHDFNSLISDSRVSTCQLHGNIPVGIKVEELEHPPLDRHRKGHHHEGAARRRFRMGPVCVSLARSAKGVAMP